jgi:hypothetical protein
LNDLEFKENNRRRFMDFVKRLFGVQANQDSEEFEFSPNFNWALEAFLNESERSSANIKERSSVKEILSRPMQEQSEILALAISEFSRGQRNFITRNMNLNDRASLHLDAIYEIDSPLIVSTVGRPLRNGRELQWLMGCSNENQFREEVSRLQAAQGVKDDPIAKHVLSRPGSKELQKPKRWSAKEKYLPELILLLSSTANLSDELFIRFLQCATERTLVDRANSSELSEATVPPRLAYPDVLAVIEHHASKSSLTRASMIALDQYRQCLRVGPHYHSVEALADGKKVVAEIADILEKQGFQFPVESRAFNISTFKAAGDEDLASALTRTLASLRGQHIGFSAVYFGFASQDLAPMDQAVSEFPGLKPFRIVHQPAMGQPLHLLSNIPPGFSQPNGWFPLLPAVFINSELRNRQVELDLLMKVLGGAASKFNFFWSVIVLWQLFLEDSSAVPKDGQLAAEDEPSCCIVLITDPAPKAGKPICKTITAWLDGLQLQDLGPVHSTSEQNVRLRRRYR